jgi:hypothetical protein
MLPVHNETILAYSQRTQDLSREITLTRDASGMLHELLHHFLQALCGNGDSGFTRTTLSSFDRTIKRLRRDPQHIAVALPFTFYDIQVELRDARIITFRAPNALAVAPGLVFRSLVILKIALRSPVIASPVLNHKARTVLVVHHLLSSIARYA